MDNYTWIFLVGIVVFFLVIVILLCFTKAGGDRLFLGSTHDPECISEIEETPALLASLSEDARISYEQAKVFQQRYPPDSIPTDITLSQFVSIQEKGVSAFEFEWDMESNSFVSARTEIQFFNGESCVQTNLPLPRNQDVYYWEAKMYEKPPNTTISVGVATKPYPHFRLPGWNKHSVAYFSNTGHKHFNNPFYGKPYGATFQEGDVVGVGYRHRSGTVFFTRNGRRLEDACTGLRWNLFPTIGANGPCQVHVNLGQMGFVFVEANVKKWGLAPMHGTLAPPPAYGLEAGSLLLERGTTAATSSTRATYRHPSSYDSDEDDDDDDDDDEQPLIQIDIPRNGNATRYPQYPPPEYSTFPRSPAMIPPALAAAARYDSGTDTEDNVSASSTSSSSNDSFLGNNNNHSRRHHHS
ncbi:endosomal spry domain [Lichtheimia corymbifera JMRC:FSU:9682]|uniref:Endosomal spry domain n=1 Tax=Lichtheimia corymbifera JMRC:FSU:9682 TaxID=1263082 RepID=A0A068S996_9FUNG|nr:endosomal spry domain [Lichtheimia corymbifera JMRC:FSU:9682]